LITSIDFPESKNQIRTKEWITEIHMLSFIIAKIPVFVKCKENDYQLKMELPS